MKKTQSIYEAKTETGEVWAGGKGCRTVFAGGRLREIELLSEGARRQASAPNLSPAHRRLLKELGEYLRGKRRKFSLRDLPPSTDFYQKVYRCLRAIPYGQVTTYGQLAAMAGRPGAARAVGTAMARNPFAILIPCHRVLAGDGSMGGYGGGLEMKRFLLTLERSARRG